jgi:hypothetical protein
MKTTDFPYFTLPLIPLYAPVTDRDLRFFAWKAAVANYHRAPTVENAESCNAAHAHKEAAPEGDHLIISGPASPICPFETA